MSEDDRDYKQLSLPFEVIRRFAPRKPNRYSLAPVDDPYQEGGGFLYENCPDVFLGRSGYGPLRVAWDTNILSDYADYGDLMWADDFDPSVPDPNYHAELIALHALMEIWLMRDIRIKIPERQIHDARRGLDAATWKFRENQINEFLAALRCIELDVEIKNNVRAFDVLPEGSTNDDWDESLVLEAIETGCHVFLTGDKRLRRRLQKNAQAAFLVIMPPTELVAALDRTGDSGFGYMLPDTHKWKHVMGATKPRDADP